MSELEWGSYRGTRARTDRAGLVGHERIERMALPIDQHHSQMWQLRHDDMPGLRGGRRPLVDHDFMSSMSSDLTLNAFQSSIGDS
jgi:hypothetical protein